LKATEFAKIAQYLTHPLVLVGFALMLVFGIHKQLLKVGILPKLDQKESGKIVQLLLKYGFWLGVIVLVLSLGLQFFQDWLAISSSEK
jgi:type II secretory pathway component PulF